MGLFQLLLNYNDMLQYVCCSKLKLLLRRAHKYIITVKAVLLYAEI